MNLVAFLSYAHIDDMGDSGEISIFHENLQREISIHTGRSVSIFFDRKSIGWGKRWSKFIDNSLSESAFLIQILTPSFFASSACMGEYERFVKSERARGRSDLVLPVYYIKCREIERTSGGNPVVDDILSRQYRDWRHLRHMPPSSFEVKKEFSRLAEDISDSYNEILDELDAKNGDKSLHCGSGDINSILDRPINYDNVVAYSVEVFPNLPVSKHWTQALINDIDMSRYKSIRDIDREVKYAWRAVSDYAQARPDLFKNSTDYITKSLIFVDAHFRKAHCVNPDTLNAAMKAGIAR